MVAVAAAVAVPRVAVRHKGRVGAKLTAEVAYIPVAGDAAARPHVKVDAVLVGPLRLTAVRGLVGLVEAKAARLPSPVPVAAPVVGRACGEPELTAVLT